MGFSVKQQANVAHCNEDNIKYIILSLHNMEALYREYAQSQIFLYYINPNIFTLNHFERF